MQFKKYAEKNLKSEEQLNIFQIRSAKIVFLFASLFFFSNLFLLGSDQNNEFLFLEKLLPLTYTTFVATLMFLGLTAVKIFTKDRFQSLSQILYLIVIVVFSIPLLVFFLGREDIISTL